MTPARPPGPAPRGLVALALLTIWIIWGSTYLGIRVAVETLPPLLMSGLRYSLAGSLLLAYCLLSGRLRAARVGREHLVTALVVGTALLAAGNGLVSWTERRIPSGLTALILSVTPLWMALADRLAHGQRLRRQALAGLLLGFAGLVLLVRPWSVARVDPLGSALLLLASLSWTAGSVHARTAPAPADPFVGTGLQMLAGGLVGLLAGTLLGEWPELRLGSVSARSVAAFAYLVLAGSIVAFSAYAWLLRHAPLSVTSTHSYVNPVVAVLLGALVLDEAVTPAMLGAGALVVTSVVLIVTSPRSPPGDAAEALQSDASA
jgi:drug/metabolite transporter (DMT)-like permease